MRILVTGAGGMLGRDVVRAAEFVNHEVIALEHSDLDVTDAPRRTLSSTAPPGPTWTEPRPIPARLSD